VDGDAVEGLRRLGHNVQVLAGWERGMFGRGQVIRCRYDEGKLVYSAGSDLRGDGMAMPVL
jgi:gamma-glutamyltranspeptidase/glutathione hydrolase